MGILPFRRGHAGDSPIKQHDGDLRREDRDVKQGEVDVCVLSSVVSVKNSCHTPVRDAMK